MKADEDINVQAVGGERGTMADQCINRQRSVAFDARNVGAGFVPNYGKVVSFRIVPQVGAECVL